MKINEKKSGGDSKPQKQRMKMKMRMNFKFEKRLN